MQQQEQQTIGGSMMIILTFITNMNMTKKVIGLNEYHIQTHQNNQRTLLKEL